MSQLRAGAARTQSSGLEGDSQWPDVPRGPDRDPDSHARPLTQILRERALEVAEWEGLGALLRRFHDFQVWHADLNLSNILLRTSG